MRSESQAFARDCLGWQLPVLAGGRFSDPVSAPLLVGEVNVSSEWLK